MPLLWSSFLIPILTAGAFLEDDTTRFWLSVGALGLTVLGVGWGGLLAWSLLSLLALPKLYQWRFGTRVPDLWIEWAVVTSGAVFLGVWIRMLIR
jgi:hypothetical protein